MTPTRTSFAIRVIPSFERAQVPDWRSRGHDPLPPFPLPSSTLRCSVANKCTQLAPKHRGEIQANARQPDVGFSSRSRGRSKFGKIFSPPRSNIPNTITCDGPTRHEARASNKLDDIASSRQIMLVNIRRHVGSNNLGDGVQSALRRPLLQPLGNATESSTRGRAMETQLIKWAVRSGTTRGTPTYPALRPPLQSNGL